MDTHDHDASSGTGRIHLSLHNNDAVFTKLSYTYPLKLLSPRVHEPRCAIAYMLTYGGGLVSGDRVNLAVEVDSDASLLLLTQGTTKVFKHRPGTRLSHGTPSHVKDAFGLATVQKLQAQIKSNGLLLLIPDPVTCFSAAMFHQRQSFHLEKGASVVVLDWITSGRISRGEEWDFTRYHSVNEILVDGRRLVRDAILLEARDKGGRSLKERMRSYSCYATLLLAGPKLVALINHLEQEYDNISVYQQSRQPPLLWSLSRMADGGVVRIAGEGTEAVKGWIKEQFHLLEEHVGHDILIKALI